MADISFIIRAIDDFSDTFSRLDSQINEAANAAKGVGTAFVVGGAAIAGGLGVATKTAAEFEQSMSRVGALSGATQAELDGLSETALKLGSETSFSAREAAEGMSFLAMAGYETNDIIAAMPGLLSAAAAGQTDLATTSDIVSNILSGFGIEAAKTADVADILTATFTSANVDLNMLGESMKYVAPIASSAGQSIESMAAATGILGNAGIQGAQAGTSLRAIITRLAAPTGRAAKTLEDLGIKTMDAQNNMRPLTDIMRDVETATADMGDAQRLAALKLIVGEEAASAFLALMDSGADTIDAFTAELENAGGTADRVANQQLDNLMGQLTILGSAIEGASISIGNVLLPALKIVVSGIQSVVDAFNRLSPTSQTIIVWAAVLASAMMLVVGGLLLLVPLAASIFSGITAIAGVFGVAAGTVVVFGAKILAVLAGLWALGVAIIAVIANFDGIRTAITNAGSAISDFAGRVLAGAIAGIEQLVYVASNVPAVAQYLWDVVTSGEAMQASIEALPEGWQTAFTRIGEIVATASTFVQTKFAELQAFLSPIIASIVDTITEKFGELQTFLAPILDHLWEKFTEFGNNVKNLFTDFSLDGLIDVLQAFVPTIIGILLGGIPRLILVGVGLLGAIAEGMGITVPELIQIITDAIVSFIETAIAQIPTLLGVGIQIFMAIIEGILTAIPILLSTVTTIIETLTATIATYVPMILETGIMVLTALIEGIVTALPQIVEVIIQLITMILETISTMLPMILEAGIMLLVGLIDGIVSNLPMIVEAAMAILNMLVNTIITLLPMIIQVAIQLITTLVDALITALPAILDAGIQIIMALIEGLISILPQLVAAAVTLITALLGAIVEFLPEILAAGIDLILALIDGLIQMLPMLVQAGFELIVALIDAIIELVPAILEAGVELIVALIEGILSLISDVFNAGSETGEQVREAIAEIDLWQVGKDIISGLIGGIGSMASAVWDKAKSIASGIGSAISGALGISSPSKVTLEMGEWTGVGLADGLANMEAMVQKSAERVANAAYVNPTIGEPIVEGRGIGAIGRGNSTVSTQALNGQSKDIEYSFEIPVIIDGREVARATAKFTEEELQRMKRDKQRASGRVGI